MHDLRFALRQLIKSPGFTAVAALSLALGIGATTTVFCWIQGIILHPLPGAAHAEQIVVLATVHDRQMWDTVSLPDLKDYRELHEVFAGIIASQITPACLTVDENSEWIYGQVTTANFFQVLGVQPILGRTFLPDEDQKPGGNPVLVLRETFWRRRFNGDPSVIGRTVELNRHSFTVVGVVPAAFKGTMGGLSCDFWAPVSMHKEVANFGSLDNRWARWLHTQARLQPGVDLTQAQAVVDAFGARLEKTYPDSNHLIRLRVLPFTKAPYGTQPIFGTVLTILLAVSVGVLLIVAANVANLLLARATGRQKEIAIRLAMGASRGRLVRQLLTESLLLSFLGGILGALIAYWAVDLLMAWAPHTYLPISLACRVDAPTLVLTLGLTLVTGIVFGLVPALQTTRPDLNANLKEGGRGSGSAAAHHRLRSLLVIAEVALSLVLLVGAGLCIKSVHRARQADIGFSPDHLLLAGLRIGMNGYTEATAKVFYHRLEERLALLPGVEAVALCNWFPLGFEGGGLSSVDVDGYERKPGEDTTFPNSIVSPHYFAVMKIPLVAGRDFTDQDDEKAPLAAIINETMARRFWPGQDAVGRKFREDGRVVTVVGIARSGKYRSLNEPPRPFFYLPYRQGIWDLNLGICVRTVSDPVMLAGALQKEIHQLDPRVEIWATLPMTEFIKAAFVAPVLASRLLSWLGVVALALAAMGVYGVMAYVVSQRTQEFGVRMALGAATPDVLRLVLKEGLVLASAGILTGLALALAATRLLATFLYGVSPFDLVTFLGVPVMLGFVTMLACWLPAHCATKVDPVTALRSE
jgi:predicted permease